MLAAFPRRYDSCSGQSNRWRFSVHHREGVEVMRSKPYPVLASAFILSAVALTAEAAQPRPYVEGEVIVKFKKALGPSEMGVAARAGQSRATIAVSRKCPTDFSPSRLIRI
jgi:hypothetical protein